MLSSPSSGSSLLGFSLGGSGMAGVVGSSFKYSSTKLDIWGRKMTTKTKMVKMIKIPIDVFFRLSKAPMVIGFNSSCSILKFLYFFLAIINPFLLYKIISKN